MDQADFLIDSFDPDVTNHGKYSSSPKFYSFIIYPSHRLSNKILDIDLIFPLKIDTSTSSHITSSSFHSILNPHVPPKKNSNILNHLPQFNRQKLPIYPPFPSRLFSMNKWHLSFSKTKRTLNQPMERGVHPCIFPRYSR